MQLIIFAAAAYYPLELHMHIVIEALALLEQVGSVEAQ